MQPIQQKQPIALFSLTSEGNRDQGYKPNGHKYICYDQLIGAGKYGKVYVGEMIEGSRKEKVAVKVVTRNEQNEKEVEKNNKLKGFGSDFLLKIYDVFSYANEYVIISELTDLDLSKVIYDQRYRVTQLYQLQERYLFSMQILQGVIDLHKKQIVHRDIKPENILMTQGEDSFKKVILADFGSVGDATKTMNTKFASPLYMHPFVMLNEITIINDIWSTLVTIIETCTGYSYTSKYGEGMEGQVIQLSTNIGGYFYRNFIPKGTQYEEDGNEKDEPFKETPADEYYQPVIDWINLQISDTYIQEQLKRLIRFLCINLFQNVTRIYGQGDTIKQLQFVQMKIKNLYFENVNNKRQFCSFFDEQALIPLILHKYIKPNYDIENKHALKLQLLIPKTNNYVILQHNSLVRQHKKCRIHKGILNNGGKDENVHIQVIYQQNFHYNIKFQCPNDRFIQFQSCWLVIYGDKNYYTIQDCVDGNKLYPIQKLMVCLDMISMGIWGIQQKIFLGSFIPSQMYYLFNFEAVNYVNTEGQKFEGNQIYCNDSDVQYTSFQFIQNNKYSQYSDMFSIIMVIIYVLSGITVKTIFNNQMTLIYEAIKKDQDVSDMMVKFIEEMDKNIQGHFQQQKKTYEKNIQQIMIESINLMVYIMKVENVKNVFEMKQVEDYFMKIYDIFFQNIKQQNLQENQTFVFIQNKYKYILQNYNQKVNQPENEQNDRMDIIVKNKKNDVDKVVQVLPQQTKLQKSQINQNRPDLQKQNIEEEKKNDNTKQSKPEVQISEQVKPDDKKPQLYQNEQYNNKDQLNKSYINIDMNQSSIRIPQNVQGGKGIYTEEQRKNMQISYEKKIQEIISQQEQKKKVLKETFQEWYNKQNQIIVSIVNNPLQDEQNKTLQQMDLYIRQLMDQNSQKDKQLSDMDSKARQYASIIKQLEQVVKEKDDKIIGFMVELQNPKTSDRNHSQENQQYLKQIQDLQNIKKNNDTELSNLQNAYNISQQQMRQIVVQIQENDKILHQQNVQIQNLIQQLQEQIREKEEIKQQYDNNQSIIQQLQQRLTDAQNDLQNQQTKFQQQMEEQILQKRQIQMPNNIEQTYEQQFKQFEDQYNQQMNELKELQEKQIKNLKQDYQRRENDLQNINNLLKQKHQQDIQQLDQQYQFKYNQSEQQIQLMLANQAYIEEINTKQRMEIDTLKQEINQLYQKLQNYEENRKILSGNLQNLLNQEQQTRDKYEQYINNQKKQYEDMIQEREEIIQMLQQQVQNANDNQQRGNIQAYMPLPQIGEDKKVVTQLREQIQKLQGQNEYLQGLLEKLEADRVSKNNHQQSNKQEQQLLLEIRQYQQENIQLQDLVQQLMQQNNRNMDQVVPQKQLYDCQQDLQNLHNDNLDKEKKIQILQQQIASLELIQQNNGGHQQTEDLLKEINRQQQTIQNLQTQIQTLGNQQQKQVKQDKTWSDDGPSTPLDNDKSASTIGNIVQLIIIIMLKWK